MAGAVSLYPAQVDPPAPSGHAFNIVRCSFTNNTAIQVRCLTALLLLTCYILEKQVKS